MKMADETTMPTPSKVEKLKERMRNKQGLSPTKAAAPPSSNVPTGPPPPATVKHTCGHEVPFEEIAKDKFRDVRYQKELKRACAACRQANQEANRKAQEEKQAKKKKGLSFQQHSVPGTGVGLIASKDRFVFGVYRRHMKTISYLGQVDKLLTLIQKKAAQRRWPPFLDHLLKALERISLCDVASRLGLENRRLLGEGIDSLPFRSGRLLYPLELQQSRNGKHPRAFFAQVVFDNLDQAIEDSRNLFPRQVGCCANFIKGLRFRPGFRRLFPWHRCSLIDGD
jgi:hypothetical protein